MFPRAPVKHVLGQIRQASGGTRQALSVASAWRAGQDSIGRCPTLAARSAWAVLDALLDTREQGVLETVSKMFSRISPKSPE